MEITVALWQPRVGRSRKKKKKKKHSSGNWKDLEGTLSQDMSTLSAYLQTWRLKLSHTMTVMAAFHLNNREAKRELKVYKMVDFYRSVQALLILG